MGRYTSLLGFVGLVGLVFGLVALWLTGQTLTVAGMVGFISLGGIVFSKSVRVGGELALDRTVRDVRVDAALDATLFTRPAP